MAELTICESASAWDTFVSGAADSSLLQAWGWGSLKARYGWRVTRYFWMGDGGPRAAISILRRALPAGLGFHYAPRGPILDDHLEEWPSFWRALKPRLQRDGGIVLKVDPEWTTGREQSALESAGARPSRHPIQHQATYLVDIRGGDEALMRMKESTRRNIRLGERAGIAVESSAAHGAVDDFYALLQQSATRHRFVIRPPAYYHDLLETFRERGQIQIYLARHGGMLLAAAVMMFFGPRLIYLYGGTSAETQALKPGYLLHWRAIQDAQRRGCTAYDMWGVPLDPTPAHPGYGYYIFKSRFNGRLVRFIGLYDLPIRPPLAAGWRLAERFGRAGQPEFV